MSLQRLLMCGMVGYVLGWLALYALYALALLPAGGAR